MKIKSQQKDNTLINQIFPRLKSLLNLISLNIFVKIFFILVISVSLIFYGATLQRNQVMASIQQIIFNGIQTNISVVKNYFQGIASDPEKIYIDISFEGTHALNFARKKAMENGSIPDEVQNLSVKAKLIVGGETYKVKLSPTGLNLDMIGSIDKRAYKVKVSDGKKIYGMSEFKLLPPSARHRMVEWVGHELQKKEGLIALKYFFVESHLNGKNLGIYAIEEHFNKELLENNNSREGLIFAEKNTKNGKRIKIFNEKKYLQNNVKNNQIVLLRSLMQSLKNNEIEIGRVFDLKKFAKHLAIIELMNSDHAFGINSFYYFNPVTSLIEPIPREYNSLRYSQGQPNPNIFATNKFLNNKDGYIYFNKLINNKEFMKYYLIELTKVSNKEYLDGFFDDIKDDFIEQQNIIFKESPFYKFPKEYMYLRQSQIKRWLNKDLRLVATQNIENKTIVEISISNNSIFPIALLKISSSQNNLLDDLDIIINPYDKYYLDIDNKDLSDANDIILTYKIYGISNDERETFVVPKSFKTGVSLPELWDVTGFYSHKDLLINSETMTVSFVNNIINIDSDIFIPKKFIVEGRPGLIINLLNGASLYSRSPFKFYGTDTLPITITSKDRKGGGIAIYSTDSKNEFINTHFEYLTSPNFGTSGLTASISIYDSEVNFMDCTFYKNDAEDFLNVIQSKYVLKDSIFKFIKSDALDSDFSNGEVNKTSFTNIGNDALDFSGSLSTLNSVYIKNIGDKAISAGENSKIIGMKINISDAEIGITSKDLSIVDLDDVQMDNTKLGFAIYKKKEEFGGGHAKITNLEMMNIELTNLIDLDSTLSLNDKIINTKYMNVADMLYGATYGKSSK